MGLALLITCEYMGLLGSVVLGTWLVAVVFLLLTLPALLPSR